MSIYIRAQVRLLRAVIILGAVWKKKRFPFRTTDLTEYMFGE